MCVLKAQFHFYQQFGREDQLGQGQDATHAADERSDVVLFFVTQDGLIATNRHVVDAENGFPAGGKIIVSGTPAEVIVSQQPELREFVETSGLVAPSTPGTPGTPGTPSTPGTLSTPGTPGSGAHA